PLVQDLFEKTSYIHPSTLLARRAVLLKVGGFDEAIPAVEDLDMWLRLAAAGAAFAFVDQVLACTEARPGSLGRSRIKMLRGFAHIYSSLDRYGGGAPELHRFAAQKCGETHRGLGWWYREEGLRWLSASHYLRSLGYSFRVDALLGLLKTILGLPWWA